jgi:hypothetical protein
MNIPWLKHIKKYNKHEGPKANEICMDRFLFINQRELESLPTRERLMLNDIIKYIKEKPKK